MGVSVLQQFPITENGTGPQTIKFLSKRLLALGAVQSGYFLVDCESYTSVSQLGSQRTIHIIHNSEHPSSVFSFLDTGSKRIPLVADQLFDSLVSKMSSFYTSKKQTKIECKGPRFELGDFLIKLGCVTMSQTFKGVLVEVEYLPCGIPASCSKMMQEFFEGFLGSYALPKSIHDSITNEYQPLDTVQQYLRHFSEYRKTSGIMSNN